MLPCLLVLLLALYAERPLDFSVFPSLLLMLTMLRLGLIRAWRDNGFPD